MWEDMLQKQAEKNSAFIDSSKGNSITAHEFAIMVNGSCRGGFGDDEDGVNTIFFACGTQRDKIEWLMALEDVICSGHAEDPPSLIKYPGAVGMPEQLVKNDRDYG